MYSRAFAYAVDVGEHFIAQTAVLHGRGLAPCRRLCLGVGRVELPGLLDTPQILNLAPGLAGEIFQPLCHGLEPTLPELTGFHPGNKLVQLRPPSPLVLQLMHKLVSDLIEFPLLFSNHLCYLLL